MRSFLLFVFFLLVSARVDPVTVGRVLAGLGEGAQGVSVEIALSALISSGSLLDAAKFSVNEILDAAEAARLGEEEQPKSVRDPLLLPYLKEVMTILGPNLTQYVGDVHASQSIDVGLVQVNVTDKAMLHLVQVVLALERTTRSMISSARAAVQRRLEDVHMRHRLQLEQLVAAESATMLEDGLEVGELFGNSSDAREETDHRAHLRQREFVQVTRTIMRMQTSERRSIAAAGKLLVELMIHKAALLEDELSRFIMKVLDCVNHDGDGVQEVIEWANTAVTDADVFEEDESLYLSSTGSILGAIGVATEQSLQVIMEDLLINGTDIGLTVDIATTRRNARVMSTRAMRIFEGLDVNSKIVEKSLEIEKVDDDHASKMLREELALVKGLSMNPPDFFGGLVNETTTVTVPTTIATTEAPDEDDATTTTTTAAPTTVPVKYVKLAAEVSEQIREVMHGRAMLEMGQEMVDSGLQSDGVAHMIIGRNELRSFMRFAKVMSRKRRKSARTRRRRRMHSSRLRNASVRDVVYRNGVRDGAFMHGRDLSMRVRLDVLERAKLGMSIPKISLPTGIDEGEKKLVQHVIAARGALQTPLFRRTDSGFGINEFRSFQSYDGAGELVGRAVPQGQVDPTAIGKGVMDSGLSRISGIKSGLSSLRDARKSFRSGNTLAGVNALGTGISTIASLFGRRGKKVAEAVGRAQAGFNAGFNAFRNARQSFRSGNTMGGVNAIAGGISAIAAQFGPKGQVVGEVVNRAQQGAQHVHSIVRGFQRGGVGGAASIAGAATALAGLIPGPVGRRISEITDRVQRVQQRVNNVKKGIKVGKQVVKIGKVVAKSGLKAGLKAAGTAIKVAAGIGKGAVIGAKVGIMSAGAALGPVGWVASAGMAVALAVTGLVRFFRNLARRRREARARRVKAAEARRRREEADGIFRPYSKKELRDLRLYRRDLANKQRSDAKKKRNEERKAARQEEKQRREKERESRMTPEQLARKRAKEARQAERRAASELRKQQRAEAKQKRDAEREAKMTPAQRRRRDRKLQRKREKEEREAAKKRERESREDRKERAEEARYRAELSTNNQQ